MTLFLILQLQRNQKVVTLLGTNGSKFKPLENGLAGPMKRLLNKHAILTYKSNERVVVLLHLRRTSTGKERSLLLRKNSFNYGSFKMRYIARSLDVIFDISFLLDYLIMEKQLY